MANVDAPGSAHAHATADGARISPRFVAQISELITGQPRRAALGVTHYMNVSDTSTHLKQLAQGVDAIRAEFDALLQRTSEAYRELVVRSERDSVVCADEIARARVAKEVAEEAHECMLYVLDKPAGSSPKIFANSDCPRDCDARGRVRNDRFNVDTGKGMRLLDFVETRAARTAKLEPAHVAAIRIYTTAAYKQLNGPLRELGKEIASRSDETDAEEEAISSEGSGRADRGSHPLPVTVSFLTAAIGKLRAVGANDDATTKLDLWRGMRDVTVPDSFMQHGGTELAPMSTTTSMEMALQYALSERALVFKLRTDSFMNRGASVKFLSAYPNEMEVLYPPLTYLRATGKEERFSMGSGRQGHIVEVVPTFGGA